MFTVVAMKLFFVIRIFKQEFVALMVYIVFSAFYLFKRFEVFDSRSSPDRSDGATPIEMPSLSSILEVGGVN